MENVHEHLIQDMKGSLEVWHNRNFRCKKGGATLTTNQSLPVLYRVITSRVSLIVTTQDL